MNSSSCSKLSVMVQTRLLRALTSWVFNNMKDRDCTTFLGNWHHCWIVYMVKEVFPTSSLKLFFFFNLCPLTSLTVLNTDKLNFTSELLFKQIISARRKLNKWIYHKTTFTSSKQIQIKAANIQDSVGIVSHFMTMLQNTKHI